MKSITRFVGNGIQVVTVQNDEKSIRKALKETKDRWVRLALEEFLDALKKKKK